MPQITVNEIDQSVVTRVVSDNRVKILVPAILSFGPAYDGTPDSVKTFTDVTDFNRFCGYTEAEFNPFPDDKSRIYARELIKRGSAVSVIRVNNEGQTATFDIGSQTVIPTSVLRNVDPKDVSEGSSFVTSSPYTTVTLSPNVIPYSISGTCTYTIGGVQTEVKFTDDGTGRIVFSDSLTAKVDYSNGVITILTDSTITALTIDGSYKYVSAGSDNLYKYIFCPQIAGIEAKYPGSFGNKLFVSISQITTKNVSEAYQYANITVYYIDYTINYYDDGTVKSRTVKNVTQLETKRVSTNPNDPYYFEDVEFEFIKIIPIPTAKEELSLVWSNIGAAPQSNQRYSGFPTITLKYNYNRNSYYNFDSSFVDGGDFNYSPEVLEKLRLGFKGYTSGGQWTVSDVDAYMIDVYGQDGNSGIIARTYETIGSIYENFTHPYIYDFDFITSGGFCYKEYVLGEVKSSTTILKQTAASLPTCITAQTGTKKIPIVPGTVKLVINGSETKTALDDGHGNLTIPEADNPCAKIDYVIGTIYVATPVTFEGATVDVSYTYYVNTNPQTNESLTVDKTLTKIPVTPGTVRIVEVNSSSEPASTYNYGDLDSDGNLYKITFTNDIPSKDGANVVGTIDYETGVITSITIHPTSVADHIDTKVSYYYNSTGLIASPVVPTSDGNASYYTQVTPIHNAMLNLVNTRQDCIALFDVPEDYDKNAIIDYSAMLNTSYGAMHFPWCYVASPDVVNKEILMAPSYIFLYTFLSNLDNNVDSQKWFPPAGVKRAAARVVKRPYFEIGSVTLSAWQNDNISRVNPIMRLKQYGYVIFGQYTTLQAIDLHTHSALESINVRLISNVVKKKIFDVCMNLAFEPNTENLWNKFFAQMDEFLRYMQYNDGLYDYKVVMDKSTVTTDDINHLRCPGKVYIAPTRTAEFFDIDFIITEAGAIFE